MWNPGFEYIIAQKARLIGYHRAPCVYSFVHRGTPEKPGIVLGLAPEGECIGLAFKVDGGNKKEVLQYLRKRELVTGVYQEIQHPIVLDSGENVEAITYVIDTGHEQYVKNRDIDHLMPFILQGYGQSGDNKDYMVETLDKLKRLEIDDEIVGEIVHRLSRIGKHEGKIGTG